MNRLLILFILLLSNDVLRAQGGKPIELENADKLEGKMIDGESVRELTGNVRFRQETVRVWCDRAIQYLSSGKLLLNGNVIVKDDSVVMRAPAGIYHRERRVAEAHGGVVLEDGPTRLTAEHGYYDVESRVAFFRSNVVVKDPTSIVTSDSLRYFRSDKRSIAGGRVRVENTGDNVVISGNLLEHFGLEGYSRMSGSPYLVQIDTAGAVPDTLVVKSRIMESRRDTIRLLLAIDSVQLVRADLSARAGSMAYYTEDDSLLLREGPVVWYGDTQVTGDSINVYLEDRKLRTVVVRGDAFAASRSDSLWPERFDQFTGETVQMHFLDRALRRVEVERQAISVYHLFEDTTANGLNRTSGDKIVMSFGDARLQSIRVYGGVEGRFVPENLLRGKEGEYLLPGFLWRDDRPKFSRYDVSTFSRQGIK